jgi:hypothetical protein
MLELVLKDCVTDTNETPWASNSSMSLAKSASDVPASGLDQAQGSGARHGASKLAFPIDSRPVTAQPGVFHLLRSRWETEDASPDGICRSCFQQPRQMLFRARFNRWSSSSRSGRGGLAPRADGAGTDGAGSALGCTGATSLWRGWR